MQLTEHPLTDPDGRTYYLHIHWHPTGRYLCSAGGTVRRYNLTKTYTDQETR